MPAPVEPPPADALPLMSVGALLDERVERLPERAIVVFDESHVPRRGRRRDPAPFRQVAIARGAPPVAVVAGIGPGAPIAAVTVEFLAHLGVQKLVTVGVAGTLDPALDANAMCIVTEARSEEGTSAHYGAHRFPDPGLTTTLAAKSGGPCVVAVTTDAPLTHTAPDIARFRSSAALIEMETAAVFAAAEHLGVASASLLVACDRYSERGWSLGETAAARPVIEQAIVMATDVLQQDAAS